MNSADNATMPRSAAQAVRTIQFWLPWKLFHISHDHTNNLRNVRLRKLMPKKVNLMRPSDKPKKRTLPANYVYKTAGDLMRWRKAQDALKKQVAEKQIVSSDRVMSNALMVWEDDGGAPAQGYGRS